MGKKLFGYCIYGEYSQWYYCLIDKWGGKRTLYPVVYWGA